MPRDDLAVTMLGGADTRVLQSRSMIICRVSGCPIAIDIESVSEVIRAAETVAVGNADQMVLGYLNVRGTHVPAIDGARALGLETRPMQPSDRFVIVDCFAGPVAILVEEVTSIADVRPLDRSDGPADSRASERITAAGSLTGTDSGVVGIIDCERLGRLARFR